MVFWVKVTGIPIHFWNNETFKKSEKRSVSSRLLKLIEQNFKFPSMLTSHYNLKRKWVSQMEIQREQNRLRRIELNQEQAPLPRGYGGGPQYGRREDQYNARKGPSVRTGGGDFYKNSRGRYSPSRVTHDTRYMPERKREVSQERDLRLKLKEQRDVRGKDVWNRVARTSDTRGPANRE
ncbi:unnamed protein product [Microthlaspi erraticum]|uniref:DUF4283 domain-containing protein n=1 Tax=Microthlaspi erraticum TaxID=1685480 RepID=A0A6D2IWG2_9BRAS|nr:unnamed protein product [Microthlaspi erraticum]